MANHYTLLRDWSRHLKKALDLNLLETSFFNLFNDPFLYFTERGFLLKKSPKKDREKKVDPVVDPGTVWVKNPYALCAVPGLTTGLTLNSISI